MKTLPLRIAAVTGTVAVASIALGGSLAGATDTSLIDADSVGTIALYDAAGNPVTTGNLSDPIAAYAVGSGGLAAGTKAALFAYVANPAANPGDWTGEQLSAATTTPAAGAPAGLPSGPTATITADSTSIGQFLAGFPTVSNGEVELRLRTTTPGAPSATTYDALDIFVSGNTWSTSQAAASTTTTLAVSPSLAKAGTNLTLTATTTDGVAGSVQFYDGATALGAAKTVAADKATTTYVVKTAGSHAFKAVFTPTDTASFQPSTGTKTVSVAKATPTVALTVPTTAVSHLKRAKVTIKVTAPGLVVGGTVKVFEGTKLLAKGTLVGGKVVITLPRLAKGTHSLKATYVASANVAAGTSRIVKLRIS
ncbi:MAG TPA: Ig-like domain repeat protein [Nocardioides sp.]|nr:Ig-like domain repeat protein [Nocardioides sp.]